MPVTVTTTTSSNQTPVPNWKAASAVVAPVIAAFVIGCATMIWRNDKNTDRLMLQFDYISEHQKDSDAKLAEHLKDADGRYKELDLRIRILELDAYRRKAIR